MGFASRIGVYFVRARWIAGALSLTCAGCAESGAPSIGSCAHECADEPTQERSSDSASSAGSPSVDAAASSETPASRDASSLDTVSSPERDAAPHSAATSDDTSDSGAIDAFEQRLSEVDEHMDYGYDDDALLHELSRTAGRAGTAQCLCYADALDEWSTGFLAGCALDEGKVELWPLPIDYRVSMDCVIAQVGRDTFNEYAACALELLQVKTACYAERQGSGECIGCHQDFTACPHAGAISAAYDVCWRVDESAVPARRIVRD